MSRTTMLAVAAAALVLGGCGQQPAAPPTTDPSTTDPSTTGRVGSCASDAAGVVHALRVRETVDLDHAGPRDPLKVTRPGSACPNILFAEVAGHYASLPLGDVRLDLRTARRVVLPGRDGDLVAVNQVHPRGGFQVHLYAYDGGGLAEVTTPSGDPPLPFVATDADGGYQSASCTHNGFVVEQAVVHEPPGIVFSWDIQETSFRLHGTTARPTGTRETKDNVLDQFLAKDHPELVRRELFRTGCKS